MVQEVQFSSFSDQKYYRPDSSYHQVPKLTNF